MPLRLRLPSSIGLGVLIALAIARPSLAAGQPSVPAWLEAHVGEGEGQIAPIVLERARALYQRKGVRNPCYFAMDATRPHDLGGGLGRRFYIICEAEGSFRAISAGHGGGRDLGEGADFANGRRCVKNFGNATGSDLTAGGAYVTGETTESFKGYYRAAGGDAVFMRAFLKFDGEGETANARERAIGGHPAVLLRGVCRRRDPSSPHADQDGYVPFGKLVNYAAGTQRRLHQLVALGRRGHHGDGEKLSDHAVHLSGVPRHRRRRAGGCGRSVGVARGALLERRVSKGHRRSKILAEGIVRADPCAVSGGPSCSAAAAAADLQGALSGHRRSVLADVTSQRLQVMLVALKGQARAVEHGRARHRFAFLGLAGLTALGDVNRAESRAASSGTESLNGCCASIAPA